MHIIQLQSKYDEYYEFEYGRCGKTSNFTHFTVMRPMEEGQRPAAENGFSKFS